MGISERPIEKFMNKKQNQLKKTKILDLQLF